jgi:beta-glucosidase/6-phospho-beta-glucosidase/beta-galactosidase
MNRSEVTNRGEEQSFLPRPQGAKEGDILPLFGSFFLGGFECSTHRLLSGRRLDLIASTKHDKFVSFDYARLKKVGIRAARDGIRWHLIEKSKSSYDFSSALPMLRAARETGLQVIWDIFHYGWPEHIDIFRPAFIDAIARFAREFIKIHSQETDRVPFVAPTNENSFFAWAGGQRARIYPGKRGRGNELKEQLVRAAIAVAEAVWEVDPRTRIIHTDPIVNVVGKPGQKRAATLAEAYRNAQYESWDMICGRWKPELGGHPKYLDIIGVNYYPHNQWLVEHDAPDQVRPYFISRDDLLYRPLRDMLREAQQRYGRPIFIAETGAEGDLRPGWLRYVCDEVVATINLGVPVQGVCLYPIMNHPGWINNRHCHNGIWDYPDENGDREIFIPLANELELQISRFNLGLHQPYVL